MLLKTEGKASRQSGPPKGKQFRSKASPWDVFSSGPIHATSAPDGLLPPSSELHVALPTFLLLNRSYPLSRSTWFTGKIDLFGLQFLALVSGPIMD